MSVQDPKQPEKFDTRLYWGVGITAILWMLLLYWFTATFNIPLGG